jgi:hypothetical protein
MSRHEIPAFDHAHRVVVGWDRPLQTYFVQVIDRARESDDEDDKFVLWRGCRVRELYEIEDLARVVRRHAELTPEIRTTLYGDKDEGR